MPVCSGIKKIKKHTAPSQMEVGNVGLSVCNYSITLRVSFKPEDQASSLPALWRWNWQELTPVPSLSWKNVRAHHKAWTPESYILGVR